MQTVWGRYAADVDGWGTWTGPAGGFAVAAGNRTALRRHAQLGSVSSVPDDHSCSRDHLSVASPALRHRRSRSVVLLLSPIPDPSLLVVLICFHVSQTPWPSLFFRLEASRVILTPRLFVVLQIPKDAI